LIFFDADANNDFLDADANSQQNKTTGLIRPSTLGM
jgi:hypothetical protein